MKALHTVDETLQKLLVTRFPQLSNHRWDAEYILKIKQNMLTRRKRVNSGATTD